MRIMVCLILTLISSCSNKITDNQKLTGCVKSFEESLNMDVYSYTDDMPVTSADILKFNTIFRKQFKYPVNQKELQTKVNLNFVVKTDGSIIDERISGKKQRDYSPVDNEGLRVLKLFGKWRPAKCNGNLVPVRITIPIILEVEE